MTSRTNHHLDTYLLRVLHTLLIEKSVSRTAIKLGQSQPTISNTLKRLRELTGDAILVRGKSGMVATERGHELLALAKEGLDIFEKISAP
jgi:DNA-binding transcriptional LysR family regulator